MRRVSTRLLVGTVAMAVAAVATACSPLGTTGAMSGPYAHTIWGPDVSSYQHPGGAGINWNSVRAQGARFVFVKVSEGNSYENPYAANDIGGARAAGLYVTGYHFARPRLPLSTATSDARTFAALMGNVKVAGTLPPVLDMETTGGLSAANATAWMKAFVTALQNATGRTPMIYSGAWFWKGYLNNPKGFSQYPVWAAQYTGGIGPNLFGDFQYSTFWQYTDAAKINGIKGGVDNSYFHGTLDQLNSLAWIGIAPATTSTAKKALSRVTVEAPAAGASSSGPTGKGMAQSAGTLGTH
ncbi:MAG: glycoside hydrolase family 25 [Mycobacterium sp.]|jgi:lysozyme|nr:glycoside hydrolase family 25 [Mycobacterium sp.]